MGRREKGRGAAMKRVGGRLWGRGGERGEAREWSARGGWRWAGKSMVHYEEDKRGGKRGLQGGNRGVESREEKWQRENGNGGVDGGLRGQYRVMCE